MPRAHKRILGAALIVEVAIFALIAWLTPLGQPGGDEVRSLADLLPLLAGQLGLGVVFGGVGGMLAAWWVRRLPLACGKRSTARQHRGPRPECCRPG